MIGYLAKARKNIIKAKMEEEKKLRDEFENKMKALKLKYVDLDKESVIVKKGISGLMNWKVNQKVTEMVSSHWLGLTNEERDGKDIDEVGRALLEKERLPSAIDLLQAV